MGNLPEIERLMHGAGVSQVGRDALSKFIIRDEYIPKLLPLVSIAEDLQSLPDLHRLCNIMKSLILLNDNAIIELVVSDHIINGVVGALECTTGGIFLPPHLRIHTGLELTHARR
jgi:protein phosphatase-4 regulatory subunit 3